jgi:hypothetical protein
MVQSSTLTCSDCGHEWKLGKDETGHKHRNVTKVALKIHNHKNTVRSKDLSMLKRSNDEDASRNVSC